MEIKDNPENPPYCKYLLLVIVAAEFRKLADKDRVSHISWTLL